MSNNLTDEDYIKILNFYKMKIPKSKRLLKLQADKILGDKLCRCIKKVDPENEARSIGICTKAVINRKGFTRGRFNCTGKKHITFRKAFHKAYSNKTKTKRRM